MALVVVVMILAVTSGAVAILMTMSKSAFDAEIGSEQEFRAALTADGGLREAIARLEAGEITAQSTTQTAGSAGALRRFGGATGGYYYTWEEIGGSATMLKVVVNGCQPTSTLAMTATAQIEAIVHKSSVKPGSFPGAFAVFPNPHLAPGLLGTVAGPVKLDLAQASGKIAGVDIAGGAAIPGAAFDDGYLMPTVGGATSDAQVYLLPSGTLSGSPPLQKNEPGLAEALSPTFDSLAAINSFAATWNGINPIYNLSSTYTGPWPVLVNGGLTISGAASLGSITESGLVIIRPTNTSMGNGEPLNLSGSGFLYAMVYIDMSLITGSGSPSVYTAGKSIVNQSSGTSVIKGIVAVNGPTCRISFPTSNVALMNISNNSNSIEGGFLIQFNNNVLANSYLAEIPSNGAAGLGYHSINVGNAYSALDSIGGTGWQVISRREIR